MPTATKNPTSESVNGAPEVLEAEAAFTKALQEFAAAEAQMTRINNLISPYAFNARQEMDFDPIATAEAEAALPAAKHRYAIAAAHKVRAERAMEMARGTAKTVLEAARREARKPFVRDIIELLEPALAAAERLNRFDLETEQRGGLRPLPPFPSLIGSLSGSVAWQIDEAKKHGLL